MNPVLVIGIVKASISGRKWDFLMLHLSVRDLEE